MKINRESFSLYLKIVPYLFLKFTMNILLFSCFVLMVLKFKDKTGFSVFISFVYLLSIILVNFLINKKILYKTFNIKNKFFMFRKNILKNHLKEKFNYEEYAKDNLILLLIGIVAFIILGLASIPLIIMVKNLFYIIVVLFFAVLFTMLFISNIISPLMLINEYKNSEEK